MSNNNQTLANPPGLENASVTPKQMVDSKLAINRELLAAIRAEKQRISSYTTPKPYVKSRPDGLEYVEEKYMRDQLNEHFPIWSWEIKNVEFLGSEWCVVTGELSIVDSSIPRKFGSVGSARIQFKKNLDHIPENIIDIDKNVASANTNAFKRAVNRLCNICDDVYRKQIEDYALSDEQVSAIKEEMDGIESTVADKILSGIEDQSISTINYDATLRKIKQLKKKEK
tara:strand:+ start:37 stop:717 length:681 start_codon:yes stop_codon:yes gene_type:complete